MRALVLADGGANLVDVARARDQVLQAGASTETGEAFFFFFFFLTSLRITGGLLRGGLLDWGKTDTLGTGWTWSAVMERVKRCCGCSISSLGTLGSDTVSVELDLVMALGSCLAAFSVSSTR